MRMTVTLSTAAVMWMFYLTLCLLIPQMDTSNAAAVLTSQGAHSGQDSIILSLTDSLIDLVSASSCRVGILWTDKHHDLSILTSRSQFHLNSAFSPGGQYIMLTFSGKHDDVL